jgi:hypothetical protein
MQSVVSQPRYRERVQAFPLTRWVMYRCLHKGLGYKDWVRIGFGYLCKHSPTNNINLWGKGIAVAIFAVVAA